jgi:hypothetical protein
MEFSSDDYRLMARTLRLRAADEMRSEEIVRLVSAARKYEHLARLAAWGATHTPATSRIDRRAAARFTPAAGPVVSRG